MPVKYVITDDHNFAVYLHPNKGICDLLENTSRDKAPYNVALIAIIFPTLCHHLPSSESTIKMRAGNCRVA